MGNVRTEYAKRYKDVDGEYRTLKELSQKYNVKLSTITLRARQGRSFEEMVGLKKIPRYSNSKKCKDHLGREFNSIKEMYTYWGLTDSEYEGRKAMGLPLEVILTGKGIRKQKPKKCKDHLGNVFNTIKEMCAYWGVNYSTFMNRIDRGYTLEDALTGFNLKINSRKVTDPIGIVHRSTLAMCKFWEVSDEYYALRVGRRNDKQYKLRDKEWTDAEALKIEGKGLRARVGTTFKGKIEFVEYLYRGRDNIDYYKCRDLETDEEVILNESNWYIYCKII